MIPDLVLSLGGDTSITRSKNKTLELKAMNLTHNMIFESDKEMEEWFQEMNWRKVVQDQTLEILSKSENSRRGSADLKPPQGNFNERI